MKTLKSYWTGHRQECISATALIITASTMGIIMHLLGLRETFFYAFGMAAGNLAMLWVNLLAHSNRNL